MKKFDESIEAILNEIVDDATLRSYRMAAKVKSKGMGSSTSGSVLNKIARMFSYAMDGQMSLLQAYQRVGMPKDSPKFSSVKTSAGPSKGTASFLFTYDKMDGDFFDITIRVEVAKVKNKNIVSTMLNYISDALKNPNMVIDVVEAGATAKAPYVDSVDASAGKSIVTLRFVDGNVIQLVFTGSANASRAYAGPAGVGANFSKEIRRSSDNAMLGARAEKLSKFKQLGVSKNMKELE